jgi:hypothetical protein
MTRKTGTCDGLAVLVAAVAAVLVADGVAGATTGAAATAAAKPKWLLIPGPWPATAIEVVGTAAGRG